MSMASMLLGPQSVEMLPKQYKGSAAKSCLMSSPLMMALPLLSTYKTDNNFLDDSCLK